ncbi:TPA: hypothetical protein ACH3X3_003379 [Trebouxia sp. C0006]
MMQLGLRALLLLEQDAVLIDAKMLGQFCAKQIEPSLHFLVVTQHHVDAGRSDVINKAPQLKVGRQRDWTAFPDALDDRDTSLVVVALHDIVHMSGRGT